MKPQHPSKEYYLTQVKQLPLYMQWGRLITKETPKFFPFQKLKVASCIGCDKKNCAVAFVKNGFTYKHCDKCGSLFVTPRPTEALLRSFYQHSRAMQFWKQKIMQSTVSERQAYQISPLTHWLESVINNYFGNAPIQAIDFKPTLTTVWDNENLKTASTRLTLAEPTMFSTIESIKNKKNVHISPSLASAPNGVDIITAFGVLEQVYNPKSTITQISKKCRKGGLFLTTTNTMSGFEYQILGKYSHRIVPPYRLNLLTIEATKKLLTKAGFEIIHCSTPGKLDVEIVADTVARTPKIFLPEFFTYLFTHRDQKTLKSFQDFLQLSNLSSHLRIIAMKR